MVYSIIASQLVGWTGLDDPRKNSICYKRLSQHKSPSFKVVRGYTVYHNYNPDGKSHEFYVLDKKQFKVLYYCAITPVSVSLLKLMLKPYCEKLVWKCKHGLPLNFAKSVFFECIVPECKMLMCSDQEQTLFGYWHWLRLIVHDLEQKYTVLLYAVDNKQNRRYIYLKDEDEEDIMSDELKDFMTGVRHRGIVISLFKDLVTTSTKAKEYHSLEEFFFS